MNHSISAATRRVFSTATRITLASCSRVGFGLAALTIAATLGCGGGNGDPTLVPTTGKITVAGKPAPGAVVTLVPASSATRDSGLRPSGQADADGAFKLTSRVSGDGAPAGEYVVIAVWPEPTGDDDSVPPKDRLKGKYADRAKSPLKATVPAPSGIVVEIP